jgi:replicative DNA helicase
MQPFASITNRKDPATEALKIPPHSIESEQSVLGGLMLDNSAWDQVADRLNESDFYRADHRLIFRAIQELAAQGLPFDVVTLAEWLERNNRLEEAGGFTYLGVVARDTPSAANIHAYADIVRERSILRQLIQISTEIANSAFQPQGRNSRTILDEAEQKVFAIAEQGIRTQTGFVSVKELLVKALERVDTLFQQYDPITGLPTGWQDFDEMTAGLQAGDLIIVAGRPSMGKCIVSGSRLLDPQTGRLRPVEAMVQSGDGSLLTVDEHYQLQPTQATHFVDDGRKPVFRVRTALGREICTTLTHPFLHLDGWKPLSELQPGDHIAVPRRLPYFGRHRLPEQQVKLLAYFIADGCLTQTLPQFTNADARLREEFIESIRCFPGVKTTLVTSGGIRTLLSVEPLQLLPEGLAAASHNSPNPVTHWLQELGLWGKDAHAKILPDIVFELEQSQMALFLNHLFACDGSAYIQQEEQYGIAYSTVSLQLARQLQHLLLRFGINAKLRHRQVNYQGEVRPCYELRITARQDVLSFIDAIGIFGKEAKLKQIRQLCLSKKPKVNLDILPTEIWTRILESKGKQSWRVLFQAHDLPPPSNLHAGRRGLSRARLAWLADILEDQELSELAGSDLYWDRIEAIDYVGEQPVYDLTVPVTHNFIAEDMLVHNTTFAMNIAENVAIRCCKPVAVFSMEMPAEHLVMRMLSSLGRIEQQRIRTGKLEETDWPRLISAASMLNDKPLFIDDTPALSPTELRARVRRLQRECGQPLGLILIDYIQLMQVPGTTENRATEVSEISRSLKALARELHVPVVALSQLNRSLEQRGDKRPIMSDLRESGSLEQDPDLICFIYRDEVYNPDSPDKGVAEIIIGKQRNGPVGTVRLTFQGRYTRFDSYISEQAYSVVPHEPSSHSAHRPVSPAPQPATGPPVRPGQPGGGGH